METLLEKILREILYNETLDCNFTYVLSSVKSFFDALFEQF